MSTNPTNAKMMLVNCHVNLTPTAHFVQPLPQGARSITCGVCKSVIHVPDHDPHSALPRQHSRKKAVICGISYQKSSHKLEGSINDAKCMKDLLEEYFHFPKTDIVMLTDEETSPSKTSKPPTKDNLLGALRWLCQGCQPGDSLVFHYSGHGLRLRNYRLSEVDGYNETLCPMDFETHGMIFDEEVNEVIVGHLPSGVKLHAIIDSRHKKSVLDLRFLYKKNSRSGQYEWENHRSDVFKGTSGGDAISFSRSVEVQTSADTPVHSGVLIESRKVLFCPNQYPTCFSLPYCYNIDESGPSGPEYDEPRYDESSPSVPVQVNGSGPDSPVRGESGSKLMKDPSKGSHVILRSSHPLNPFYPVAGGILKSWAPIKGSSSRARPSRAANSTTITEESSPSVRGRLYQYMKGIMNI